ncbi:MAG: 2-oxo acid dehydrogenase subunit E2 [Phycisphaeraceae bacterium]|nr:2-oxo acid dehydrogenase subunit E2 [Phycisphaeraceae bacterium]
MAHATSSDPNVFILPDLGEGVHEAELIKWRVQVGQEIKELDILAEMETDKAVVEVPSPRAGVIKQLHGNEGEILHVGNVLVSYEGGAATPQATPAPTPAKAKHEPKPSAIDLEEPPAEREDAGTVVGSLSSSPAVAQPGKALATPAVRRLAKELGINIDAVQGTGIGGRVTEKDVRATGKSAPAPKAPAAAKPAGRPQPQTPAAPEIDFSAATRSLPRAGGDDTTRLPFRGVRRTIANRLRESMNQAVHFTVMDEADVSGLDALRKRLASASGEKVSLLPFVASAVCRVLGNEKFRALNATVDEKPGDAAYEASIVQHRGVHLGIATDTDNGLMVPVIPEADRLGVLQIGRAITQVAEQARARTISRDQLTGSTFTISNVGSHAGRFATPVINYPEVGILAVGRAREGMVVNKGTFRVGLLLPLSLACDHRVVDGATAALALAEIVRLLQTEAESLMSPARG